MREQTDADRIEELERALGDALDVATWLTGFGPLEHAPAWPAMRERLTAAMRAMPTAIVSANDEIVGYTRSR